MKMKALLLGAAASLALAGTANAGFERDGWYFGLEGGAVMVNETQLTGPGVPAPMIEFDHGYGVLGTLGYAFKNSNWRMEGEVGYRQNDGFQTLGVCGFLCIIPAGDSQLKEWSGMINAVYDIKMSDRFGLGLGVGIGIDNPRYSAPDGTDSNDKVFAAQALAGFTYRVNQHWDLMLNYRYLWAGEAEFQANALPIERTMDLEKHTITVGFRYGYDEPRPDPVCTNGSTGPYPDCPLPKVTRNFNASYKCGAGSLAVGNSNFGDVTAAREAAVSNGSPSVRIVLTVASGKSCKKKCEDAYGRARDRIRGDFAGVPDSSLAFSRVDDANLGVKDSCPIAIAVDGVRTN